jgi:hypothetical protein
LSPSQIASTQRRRREGHLLLTKSQVDEGFDETNYEKLLAEHGQSA